VGGPPPTKFYELRDNLRVVGDGIGRRLSARARRAAGAAPTNTYSLASRSVGLPSDRLVTRCSRHGPDAPTPVAAAPPFALAFSGGGFRASLAAAGVLRFVADAGLLGHVRYVSSVSGGSITNGLLAANYEELQSAGFAPEKVDELVISPLIREITRRRSLMWKLVGKAPRLALGKTRAELLSDTLAERFFNQGTQLATLPRSCRFIFNASNLATGVRFELEPTRVGDYVLGFKKTDAREGKPLLVADAVAASAAFPGAFSPFYLDGYQFHCPPRGEPPLVDGGVYDNLGLEVLGKLPNSVCLIVINAGGLFHTGFVGGVPLVGALMRDNALLYRQSTSLRTRVLVERYEVYEQSIRNNRKPPKFSRQGVLFSLASMPDATEEWETGRPALDWDEVKRLANIKTGFSRLARKDCEALVDRGWWLAGATLSAFHRSLLPAELPRRRPL
jgi:NTE family protein